MTIACSIYSLPCFWDKCLVLLYGVQQLWNFYEQRDCGHVPSDAVGKIQQVISIRPWPGFCLLRHTVIIPTYGSGNSQRRSHLHVQFSGCFGSSCTSLEPASAILSILRYSVSRCEQPILSARFCLSPQPHSPKRCLFVLEMLTCEHLSASARLSLY